MRTFSLFEIAISPTHTHGSYHTKLKLYWINYPCGGAIVSFLCKTICNNSKAKVKANAEAIANANADAKANAKAKAKAKAKAGFAAARRRRRTLRLSGTATAAGHGRARADRAVDGVAGRRAGGRGDPGALRRWFDHYCCIAFWPLFWSYLFWPCAWLFGL